MSFPRYPTFMIVGGWKLIPRVNLPNDFRNIIPKFYEECGREEVERYARELTDFLGMDFVGGEVKLKWVGERGLTNLSILGAGRDLSEDMGTPEFVEHNLGGYNGLALGMIAQEYVSQLLNLKEVAEKINKQ